MPAKKRARSANTKINEEQLFKDLEPLAKLRRSLYRWDGKDYSKPSRSLGPARDELQVSLPALRILVDHAPNGYPDFAGMKRVWNRLHLQHRIMEDLDDTAAPAFIQKELTKSVDVWRTKLAHMIGLKKTMEKQRKRGVEQNTFAADFQAVLDIIVVKEAGRFFFVRKQK